MGPKPSERWGHSSCYFNGSLYIFGGCRGGVHFSDVLVCSLTTTTWTILKTSGMGPGPRDSHTAVTVGHKMLVFGGTNGSKKVNDLHVLNLLSGEWTRPNCLGNPPSARESHTAHVIDDDKLIVFGGSGEGGVNYLNDLHILDLKSMEWSSPEVKGCIPAPRDSHSAVAIGNRMFVFGGDSGDRYQGDVSVLDLNKMTWSTLDACGPSPGARAGHAAVSIGTKVYVVGGVGDKQYYNDVWILDVITSSWCQLDVLPQESQGRFSHTATITNIGIAIFGGCGEDERPLNELLFLQMDSITSSNIHKDETKMFLKKEENNMHKAIFVSDDEDLATPEVEELQFVPKQSFRFSSDMLHPKRRRTSNSKVVSDRELNSRQSSPPKSNFDHSPSKKSIGTSCPSACQFHPLFRQKNSGRSCYPVNNEVNPIHVSAMSQDIYLPSDDPNQIKQELTNTRAAECVLMEARKKQNLVGAEVHGQVDGAFDSGYLMTATVNGKVFRGVLFALGPDIETRGAGFGDYPIPVGRMVITNSMENRSNFPNPRLSQQPGKLIGPGLCHISGQSESRKSSPENSRVNAELEGVVLTLASPGDHAMI